MNVFAAWLDFQKHLLVAVSTGSTEVSLFKKMNKK